MQSNSAYAICFKYNLLGKLHNRSGCGIYSSQIKWRKTSHRFFYIDIYNRLRARQMRTLKHFSNSV